MGLTYYQQYCTRIKKISSPYAETKDVNSNYRCDAVYKDCSYPKITTKSPSTYKACFKCRSQMLNNKLNDHFSWNKVYRSPVNRKQSQEQNTIKNESTESNNPILIPSPSVIDIDQHVHDTSDLKPSQVTIQTSTIVVPKEQLPISKKRNICSNLLPKLLCPCCTGGGDDRLATLIQSFDGSLEGSYEDVDLKPSNIEFLSLNAEPSIMSIIHLHKTMIKKKKTTKFYAKILQSIIKNSFKNFTCVFK